MEEQNPWWVGEPDPVYEEWAESDVRWRPGLLRRLGLRPYSLHFLLGPRQVGKTTLLKILVHDLLGRRDPRSIFYYSCDELVDHRELGEVLDNYLSARRVWGVRSSVIILDEVTFVSEWHRAVKSRIDRGLFRRDVVIVSGSASLELLAGKEMFPGRRGFGRDLYMHPLSFHEYARLLGGLGVAGSGLESIDDFWAAYRGNMVFSKKLAELFSYYLKTGGYPIPIRELFEGGRVSYASYKSHLDWLRADWLRVGRNEGYMKEVISYLLEATPSPVGWHTIARHTSLGSPHTARLYVETLENLMVARVVYWASPSGKPDYRKNKKIFFTDPFTYGAFSLYTRMDVEEVGVVEATVSTHISRRYRTYYWRNASEVDVVAVTNKDTLGFEVKWRRKPKTGRKPLKTFILDRSAIPVFLATLKV